jgi:adenylate kinase
MNFFETKSAWLNEPELLCYGEGDNFIPTIHLDDLVSIIVEVTETTPETRYILAVDDSKSTLYDFVKVQKIL